MADPIIPMITEAGLIAVFNASSDGVQAVISHIGLGDGQWDTPPDKYATGLLAEQQRIPIAEGARVDDKQIRVTGKADDGGVEFWVNELGFYLDDGTLLAIWADKDKPIAWKSIAVDLFLSFDLVLEALPIDAITVPVTVEANALQLAEEMTRIATASINQMLSGMLKAKRMHVIEQQLGIA